ncbi:MAG: ATP-binding protein, partial [Bacteroidota bacterium]
LWIYQQKNKELIKKKSIPLKAEFYNFVEIAGRTLFATSRGILELDIDSLLLKEVEPELTFALNNHTPYDLLEDKNSDLWIPTNKTLVRYNLETKEAATFRKEDGFISTEFSDYMKNLVASDGKIWLGTNKGVVVFHPDSIQPYPYPPNPYIDGLKVNNEPYQGKVVAGEAEAITLDYRQNTLELDLLAIGYYLPKESTVEYQLLNYEDEISSTPNGTSIRYTQIPPGAYTFQYTAVNINGLRSEPKSLQITITPPFWQRTWFRILELLAFLGLSYLAAKLYARYKTRQQRIELKKQKAIQEVRDKIGSDLHDSVAGNLSIIRATSDMAGLQLEDGVLKSELEDISNYAGRSVDLMKTIVWALNSDNDSLENLTNELRSKAAKYAHAYQLSYHFEIADDLPDLQLGSERLLHIYMISNEALHNIVKYAEATEFSISIRLQSNQLHFQIIDNGKGFDEKDSTQHGQGLRNMRKRAVAMQGKLVIDSKSGKGTMIELEIPIVMEKQSEKWWQKLLSK